ncbi:hypothetical protein PVT68_11620 [Microbulbifer bruguierae]|uniref:Uncharacterized protein n=1 Tax=Microbulbifer bruguierae TaxID=3029061 RepID=A0ABY8N951_9GAMM|nr:hypothetical protein [Microbulbifer bruguierae]WGL15416.1 hypothetical protein PVT68_11620 [Microbulbifer bruguierae]
MNIVKPSMRYLLFLLFISSHAESSGILESEDFIDRQTKFVRELEKLGSEMQQHVQEEFNRVMSIPDYVIDYRNPSIRARTHVLILNAIRFKEETLSKVKKDDNRLCQKKISEYRTGELSDLKEILNRYIEDEHHVLFPVLVAGYAKSQGRLIHALTTCEYYKEITLD